MTTINEKTNIPIKLVLGLLVLATGHTAWMVRIDNQITNLNNLVIETAEDRWRGVDHKIFSSELKEYFTRLKDLNPSINIPPFSPND